MKKSVFLLIGVLLLSACGHPGETAKSSASSATETTKSQATGSTKQTSEKTSSDMAAVSTTASSTTTSSGNSSATSSSKSSEESSAANATPDAFKELKQHFSDVVMPSAIPHAGGSYLNIASTGDTDNFSILYYAMDQPLIMNHKDLNHEKPFASFKKTTYQTVGQAKDAVDYVYDDGGKKVNLGHNIAGYMQGAAGSSYLNWKEGNWALTVRASNVEGQDPVPTAKEVVEYLEKAFLPVPKSVGMITIDLASEKNYQAGTVTWQRDQVVYTASDEDPLSALEMAVSTVK